MVGADFRSYSGFRQEKDSAPPTRPLNGHFENASGTRKTISWSPLLSPWARGQIIFCFC